MTVFDHSDREDDIISFYRKLKGLRDLAELAKKFGIHDIFQDNGAKILQTLVFAGLDPINKRAGNDAHDDQFEYELKTANEELVSSFSTHHHLTKPILDKYRSVKWIFSIYSNSELREIWIMDPVNLKKYFDRWEPRIAERGHLNNPKIPFSFVRKNAKLAMSRDDCERYRLIAENG